MAAYGEIPMAAVNAIDPAGVQVVHDVNPRGRTLSWCVGTALCRSAIRIRPWRTYTWWTVSTSRADNADQQHLELPVEELLHRARPLPPHDEMVIEDLTEEEGAAFLSAVDS